MHKTQLKYDIILVHDVIEHIKPEYKIAFVTLAQKLLSVGGVIFGDFQHGKCLLEDINKYVAIHLYPTVRLFIFYLIVYTK